MKVLICLIPFDYSSKTGMNRRILLILRGLVRLKKEYLFTILITQDNYEFFKSEYPSFSYKVVYDYFMLRKMRSFSKLYWFYNCLYVNFYCIMSSYELYYFDFISAFSPCLLTKKKVFTIHHLPANIDKVSLKDRMFYNIFLTHNLKHTYYFSISEYTKNEIMHFYPAVKEDRLYVNYNPIEVLTSSLTDPILNYQYILCVNTFHPKKNTLSLIRAFNIVKKNKSYKLVLVSSKNSYWNNVLFPEIVNLGLKDDVVCLGDVLDDELENIYRSASLFVTPSLREGFGYTPIEAAIYKIPVLVSMESALPETTCGLVNYYEPAMDEEVLAERILYLLSNPPSEELLDNVSFSLKSKYSVENRAKIFYSQIIDILKVGV